MWYKKDKDFPEVPPFKRTAQSFPSMGIVGPSNQTSDLFGDVGSLGEEINPRYKSKINLHLNRALRDLSSSLNSNDLNEIKRKINQSIHNIQKAQRRVDKEFDGMD